MPEPNTGCWIWMLSLNRTGYGQFSLCTHKKMEAHKFSWLFHYKEIPKGLWVLHKCDNRQCVNPEHLFLGTAQDNTNDMIRKKRVSIKLSPYQAEVIRSKYKGRLSGYNGGVTLQQLADEYGVHPTLIRNIVFGKIKSYLKEAA